MNHNSYVSGFKTVLRYISRQHHAVQFSNHGLLSCLRIGGYEPGDFLFPFHDPYRPNAHPPSEGCEQLPIHYIRNFLMLVFEHSVCIARHEAGWEDSESIPIREQEGSCGQPTSERSHGPI